MKVFEVVTEYSEGDSKEVIKSAEYVTSRTNSMLNVVAYFTNHCNEYEKELISVREVLTVVQEME